MPLKRRGKLLAGVAALVALSVAGPGCRTNDVCKTCCAAHEEAGSGQPGAMCVASGRQDGGRFTFPVRPRMTTTEPGVAEARTCQTCPNPTAIMLRPVPLGSPTESPAETPNGKTSTWTPVQRVSGEVPALQEADLTPVASLGSPMPSSILISSQAPAGDPLLPVPSTPALAGRVADMGDGKAAGDGKAGDGKADAKPKSQTLHMPKATGYPDLGPAMITQPMDAPREFQMRALSTYIVEPPDILSVDIYLPALRTNVIRSEQLVRPDGTIGFNAFPPMFVAGLTLEQIKRQLAQMILPNIDSLRGRDDGKQKDPITLDDLLRGMKVDVLRYNSKYYYVITDGGGYGEQVTRVALTGNERVLDAVATIQGLPAVASKKRIWVARATPHDHDHPQILPVDWCGIVQRGSAATNFQMFPGDRLYINSDKLIRTDSYLNKLLSPVERLLGVTLLGSSVVNSIKNGGNGGGNNGGINR